MLQDWRTVRVFVSSTFLDLKEERDELARHVFPPLRRLCDQRRLVFIPVDLRWGVTDEQIAEGLLLRVVLDAVRRCRPFFVGILGERYGTPAGHLPADLLRAEPWLAAHRATSLTELEMLHGVLNDPALARRACFYFRDPAYLQRLPPHQRRAFVEADPGQRDRLAALKERIVESGRLVRPDYPDPKTLGEWVLRDLTAALDEEYPAGDTPPEHERERLMQAAFAASHGSPPATSHAPEQGPGVYVGRSALLQRLDAHARGAGPPVVVTGESGSGKSALLANWAARHERERPDVPLVAHFIGASPYSGDWTAIVRRLLMELGRHSDVDPPTGGTPEELRAAFRAGLYAAAAHRRIVVILDGLDQLSDGEGAADLVWLPAHLPANLRVIASALPGRALSELRRREWSTLHVEPLSPAERRKLIDQLLGQSIQALDERRRARLASSAPCALPLFLRALLGELQVCGTNDTLDADIDHYLSAATPSALYERILERYEEDYQRHRPGLVRDAMSALWAARHGLSEPELLDVLGAPDTPTPRAYWQPLYDAARHVLVDHSGLTTFVHPYARDAVHRRYLRDEGRRGRAHGAVADYFKGQPLGDRKVSELPWQHYVRGALGREGLYDAVTDLDLFMALLAGHESDAFLYWRALRAHHDLPASYLHAVERDRNHRGVDERHAWICSGVGKFLEMHQSFADAERLMRSAIEIEQQRSGAAVPVGYMTTLGLLLMRLDRGDEAHPLFERVVGEVMGSSRATPVSRAHALNNLGLCCAALGRWGEAESWYRKSLAVAEQQAGTRCGASATACYNLASCFLADGNDGEAESMLRLALEVAREVWGSNHTHTALYMAELASQIADQRPHEARELALEARAVYEAFFGPGDPAAAGPLKVLAQVHLTAGELPQAETLLRSVAALEERARGRDHLALADALLLLGRAVDMQGRPAEALPLVERSTAILGARRPGSTMALRAQEALRDLKRRAGWRRWLRRR